MKSEENPLAPFMSLGMEKCPLTFEATAAFWDGLVLLMKRQAEKEAASSPKGGMAWGNLQQCARHFGMSRDSLERLLPDLVAAGKVRVLKGQCLNGKRALKRYHIGDIERALA